MIENLTPIEIELIKEIKPDMLNLINDNSKFYETGFSLIDKGIIARLNYRSDPKVVFYIKLTDLGLAIWKLLQ